MNEPRQRSSQTRGILKNSWRAVPPSRFLDYKDFLRSLYDAVKRQCTDRYTYNQYSDDLGFSSANAAYIVIHGYRRMNAEQAESLIATLGIAGAERRYLLKLMDYTDCQDEAERQKHFTVLVAIKDRVLSSDEDRLMLRFFSDWYHAAIFELVDLPDFRSEADWIASRFYKRLTPEQVVKSLELLEALQLITYDATQRRHVKKNKSLTTGDEVRGLAVAGYHMQMLEMSQSALSQIPADEREIGAVTLSVTEDIARRLKEDVRLFRRYAVFLSEQCTQSDRIVQLNLQLFPITRTGE